MLLPAPRLLTTQNRERLLNQSFSIRLGVLFKPALQGADRRHLRSVDHLLNRGGHGAVARLICYEGLPVYTENCIKKWRGSMVIEGKSFNGGLM
jgi:hypothetical protein